MTLRIIKTEHIITHTHISGIFAMMQRALDIMPIVKSNYFTPNMTLYCPVRFSKSTSSKPTSLHVAYWGFRG